MKKKFVVVSLILFTTSIIGESLNTQTLSTEPSVFSDNKTSEMVIPQQQEESIVSELRTFFDTKYHEVQDKILKFAFSFLGQEYKFGASKNSTKTDCSLYTQNVFSKIGIKLPRSSIEQSTVGIIVPKEDLQVGDLLFFKTYRQTPSHVGIYIGDNKMIHASFKNNEVMIETLDKKYYKDRFLFAKRVI